VLSLIFVLLLAASPSISAAKVGGACADAVDTARDLLSSGRYLEAEELARSLLDERERVFGSRSLESADALDVLVQSLVRGGKLREPDTLSLARKAVELREQLGGANHPMLADSLHHLGIVLWANRDVEAARVAFERSMEIRRRSLGESHPDFARSLQFLGELLDEIGEADTAWELLERSLDTRQQVLGPDHPDVAESLKSLARYHYKRA
jgi:tetratricopeptide (TPR) repeat protein